MSQDVKEANEKIARFMGLVRFDENRHYALPQWYKQDPEDARKKGKFMGYPDQLQYHEKWDWLMPVVEKILKTYEPVPGKGWPYAYVVLEETSVGNNIDIVFQRVIAFIDWYNEQNEKKG